MFSRNRSLVSVSASSADKKGFEMTRISSKFAVVAAFLTGIVLASSLFVLFAQPTVVAAEPQIQYVDRIVYRDICSSPTVVTETVYIPQYVTSTVRVPTYITQTEVITTNYCPSIDINAICGKEEVALSWSFPVTVTSTPEPTPVPPTATPIIIEKIVEKIVEKNTGMVIIGKSKEPCDCPDCPPCPEPSATPDMPILRHIIPTVTVTPEPTQEIIPEPTEEPTQEPTPEPVEEPVEEPVLSCPAGSVIVSGFLRDTKKSVVVDNVPSEFALPAEYRIFNITTWDYHADHMSQAQPNERMRIQLKGHGDVQYQSPWTEDVPDTTNYGLWYGPEYTTGEIDKVNKIRVEHWSVEGDNSSPNSVYFFFCVEASPVPQQEEDENIDEPALEVVEDVEMPVISTPVVEPKTVEIVATDIITKVVEEGQAQ